MMNTKRLLLIASFLTATATAAHSQQTATKPAVLDEVIAPGANFDKAEFRLFTPQGNSTFRGVLVLVPGSNGDGRAMAEDTVWQAFATKQRLAIVACRFTDKPHDQGFIEHYVNVSQGSGQALLDVLSKFAARSGHAEIANAPLLFWGMSAGGEFNYEFAAWKPERVAAFVVNKGGIYYTALVPRATREIPALLFIGGKDLDSRVFTISGLFAVNRRAGAVWALVEEPGAAHVVGQSRHMSMLFFEDVLELRSTAPATAFTEKAGFLGDIHAKTTQRASDVTKAAAGLTSWLPTERVAQMWEKVVNGR